MSESITLNSRAKIFLGVDGGQSHTEAVVADENGNLLGRGFGGASNHAEHPGGRERLRSAVLSSVGEALKNAGLGSPEKVLFTSAHFGMTGGADFKQAIIGEIIKADHLQIGHDAPSALFGSTAGKAGIVVIAGTGSVVYGENERGESARIGGLGYLFSDEGSGFWLAAQIVRLAIKEQDNLIETAGLRELVLNYFKRETIRDLTNDFYFAKISRDELASFARAAHDAAFLGNKIICEQIKYGARVLVESVASAARKLESSETFPVAAVGGMFRGALMKKYFAEFLREIVPAALFINPRFNPAIGALLLAYKQAQIKIDENLLAKLEKTQD